MTSAAAEVMASHPSVPHDTTTTDLHHTSLPFPSSFPDCLGALCCSTGYLSSGAAVRLEPEPRMPIPSMRSELAVRIDYCP